MGNIFEGDLFSQKKKDIKGASENKSFSPKAHIVFTVINDLNYDQRMQRIATALVEAGYEVSLIGRLLPQSPPLKEQNFHQIRFPLHYNKGKLFYLEYNLRLLWWLLWHSYDIYGAIDLDTIAPQTLVAKLKNRLLVYDAHEYFPEVPEVIHRPRTKMIWEKVEAFFVPKVDMAYTVSHAIGDIFWAKYQKKFAIIRNIAPLKSLPSTLPPKNGYILYQGAVNIGRGLDTLIRVMPHIDAQLIICGQGDAFEDCTQLIQELQLEEKVEMKGWVPPEQLRAITLGAKIGFNCYDKNMGTSYYLSLANRFFDYFHAGIPQICANYPEYRRLNNEIKVAVLINELNEKNLLKALQQLLNDPLLYDELRNNCLSARNQINWQEESKKLCALYDELWEQNKPKK